MNFIEKEIVGDWLVSTGFITPTLWETEAIHYECRHVIRKKYSNQEEALQGHADAVDLILEDLIRRRGTTDKGF